jgi:hypothetical protein
MRTGLALPYMLGIDVISFFISMSLLSHFSKYIYIGEEDAEFFFSFDSFSDIAYVFA